VRAQDAEQDGRVDTKMERLTVSEAAERLEISQQAVRKRLQRGTLPHAKQDGRVYVYLDSERGKVSPQEGLGSDNQATLNYIDKLYISWQALSNSQRRFVLLMYADSILVLALSGGAVFTEETLTILGVGFKVPLVVFMVTGAVLLPLFSMEPSIRCGLRSYISMKLSASTRGQVLLPLQRTPRYTPSRPAASRRRLALATESK
jgi:excisionase family DNA binding protein